MCVAVAKYFPKIGWVLAKNRDQDYISDISFEDKVHPATKEILVLHDKDTGYREGMNYTGLTIITTSLTPNLADETDRVDGEKIYNALKKSSPEDAAKYLIAQKLTGFIFIANSKQLILVEAAKTKDDKGTYHATMRNVPKTETIVRTNHGVEFPWAGFQFGYTEQQDIWRKSSELRKKYTEAVVRSCKNPQELLDALAKKNNNDLQMNPFRVEYKPRQMRTIFQWVLVPSEDTIYVRPIQCKMKSKVTPEMLRIVFLDNSSIKKTFPTVKHLCKMKIERDGIVHASESVISFSQYIEKINLQ
jgi:hypothetical protein